MLLLAIIVNYLYLINKALPQPDMHRSNIVIKQTSVLLVSLATLGGLATIVSISASGKARS